MIHKGNLVVGLATGWAFTNPRALLFFFFLSGKLLQTGRKSILYVCCCCVLLLPPPPLLPTYPSCVASVKNERWATHDHHSSTSNVLQIVSHRDPSWQSRSPLRNYHPGTRIARTSSNGYSVKTPRNSNPVMRLSPLDFGPFDLPWEFQ